MRTGLKRLVASAILVATAAAANPYIVVDQFGYRPGDAAPIAIIADPQESFNK